MNGQRAVDKLSGLPPVGLRRPAGAPALAFALVSYAITFLSVLLIGDLSVFALNLQPGRMAERAQASRQESES